MANIENDAWTIGADDMTQDVNSDSEDSLADNDVLNLQIDEDLNFEENASSSVNNNKNSLHNGLDKSMNSDLNTSRKPKTMIDFGLNKDRKSVNWRLKPENVFVDRPEGMPPLMHKDTAASLKDLEKTIKQAPMHAPNRSNSRMSRNGSRSRRLQNHQPWDPKLMARNQINNPIGNRLMPNHAAAQIQKNLAHAIQYSNVSNGSVNPVPFNPIQADLKPKMMTQSNIQKCMVEMESDGIANLVYTINRNFGPKYNMAIQKEISEVQNKPLVYSCAGNSTPITMNGPGIHDVQITPRATGISLNCRFSQL